MTFALVLGSAACVWDDVERLRGMTDIDAWPVVACNDAGWAWPGRLDHWVSLDWQRNATKWLSKRDLDGKTLLWKPRGQARVGTGSGLLPELQDVTSQPIREFDVGDVIVGTSGGLAASVALKHVADRAVLCGIPLNAQPHFPGAGSVPGNADAPPFDAVLYAEKLSARRDVLRSMSGRTREWLGEPTPAWLREEE